MGVWDVTNGEIDFMIVGNVVSRAFVPGSGYENGLAETLCRSMVLHEWKSFALTEYFTYRFPNPVDLILNAFE